MLYRLIRRGETSIVTVCIHKPFHACPFQNDGKFTVTTVRIQIIAYRLPFEYIVTVTFHTVIVTAHEHAHQEHHPAQLFQELESCIRHHFI